MQLTINGKITDITLENEKTAGEVLYGIEQWLEDSGHRITEIGIDGENISASMIEDIFSREIASVKVMDIRTKALADLAMASLVTLLDDVKEYETLDFENKTNFFNDWKDSAQGQFISQEIHDLYTLCHKTFSGGDIAPDTLYSITEERIREANEPLKELANTGSILDEVCEKLINLPLDIQTGKDMQAAQTIQVFSAITEKIFRIYYQFDIQGYLETESKKQITHLITDFSGVLKELLDAYEKKDSVLVGDIAEYEASEKLYKLYVTIKNSIKGSLQAAQTQVET